MKTIKAKIDQKVREFALIWFIKILIALFKVNGGKNYLAIDFALDEKERFVIGMARKDYKAIGDLLEHLYDFSAEAFLAETQQPTPEPAE